MASLMTKTRRALEGGLRALEGIDKNVESICESEVIPPPTELIDAAMEDLVRQLNSLIENAKLASDGADQIRRAYLDAVHVTSKEFGIPGDLDES